MANKAKNISPIKAETMKTRLSKMINAANNYAANLNDIHVYISTGNSKTGFPVPVAPVATLDNLSTLYQIIENSSARSAWSRGVRSYALDIIEDITEFSKFNLSNGYELPLITEDCALNGAEDWARYATGGCGAALIWPDDIAERLCTPSELRIYQKRGGDTIEWQGRALFQAWRLISQNLGKLS